MKQSSRIQAPLLTLMLDCIMILFLFSACASSYGNSPAKGSPNVQNPPLYPGAQNVQDVAIIHEGRVLTYQVNAKPEDVLAYYRNTMSQDGWSEMSYGVPNALRFAWVEGPEGAVYDLFVATLSGNGGATEVQLAIGKIPSH